MPIGIIIYIADRIILKANNIAAKHYSCKDEKNMEGNYFETILRMFPNTFQNIWIDVHADQLVIIKQEDGENFNKNTVQVNFEGEPPLLKFSMM